jgi:hypothetical protein
MGNDPVNAEEIAEQEKGIEILRNLPTEAKMYLCHHFRNALAPAIGLSSLMLDEQKPIALEYIKTISECLDHAIKDLQRIGC